jgi:alpha-mannosidase
VDGVPSVGYQIFGLSSNSQDAELSLSKANSEVSLETEHFKVAFSRETGAMVQLLDKSRNIDWGHERCGRLTGVRESGNDVTLRIASDAEVASDSLEGIQIEEENGLYVSVLVRRRFLKCSVEQRIVLWKTEARIDFETRIFWYGARDWQVRMSLPLASSRADISHGMAFYGANWNTIAPGAGPHNPDELLPEDYACYREVLDWVHLTKGDAGLSIITDHPAFHATNNELSAVLLRTATSCGDIGWLWWENAGEQVFRFTFVPGQGNWNEAKVPQRAAAILRPPQVQIAESTGGELEKAFSFLSVDGGAMVSAIYPGKDSKKINLRIVEPIGKSAEVMFNGPLARGSAELTDLLGNPKGSPTGDSGRWSVSLKPWTIQTIQFSQ